MRPLIAPRSRPRPQRLPLIEVIVPNNQMLINYIPGEECRVAVVSDGKLEDLYEERSSSINHVGDIYVGRIVNVEPAIQAAFIDFGLEHNGFLHISDLHPQYFPGEDQDTTERVGKKTPRRSRPPIQNALRRGQEITVQVLKEGIGTKGPTLTSYLSIPGRSLVMMPGMDRVGVSRKLEDPEERRKLRQTLDDLKLPESFGFILRTAGVGRTKTELKRDLAYLQRLWKDMERRRKQSDKPRLLYAESDLLARSLRDLLASDVDEVVIDNEVALRRAARFMKIVAPRSTTKLLQYESPEPIFHAYGVEEQIERIHARHVPLPSGGSLVIDETEALVAIDVNSGKMRSAGDAETTAFRTNLEAVDEICRQLRLRDLGGLVLHDLIDMRSRAHRREIEQRFRTLLKKDRARAKILPISQFGIVEMTRQRMRGSMRSSHWASCPQCAGRGVVQRPDSVANLAMREMANLLQYERVQKVVLVVSPRVAGELLSAKRLRLARMERSTGKHVDVRVSEALSVDRITFEAYDERGADIDIARLPKPAPPSDLKPWTQPVAATDTWASDAQDETAFDEFDQDDQSLDDEMEMGDLISEELDEPTEEAEPTDQPRSKRRRRRRRKRSGDDEADSSDTPDAQPGPATAKESEEEGAPVKKKRRRRRSRRSKAAAAESHAESAAEAPAKESTPQAESQDDQDGAPRKKKRRRRRRKGRAGADESVAPTQENSQAPPAATGLRGDSWDLDPADVAPAPARNRSAPKPTPSPAPAPVAKENSEPSAVKPGKTEAPPRGDSWDLDPADVTPAPAKLASKSKRRTRSRRKKSATSSTGSASSAATTPATKPAANTTAATPDTTPDKPEAAKKKTTRKRQTKKKTKASTSSGKKKTSRRASSDDAVAT